MNKKSLIIASVLGLCVSTLATQAFALNVTENKTINPGEIFTGSDNGEIHVINNSTLTNNGTINNTAIVEVQNGSTINNTGTVVTNAELQIRNGATFENSGKIESLGTVFNQGTLKTSADNVITGNFLNDGTLNLSGTINQNINGGGKTVVDNSLNIGNLNEFRTGNKINLNNGTLTISEGSTTSMYLTALEGSGNLNLDIDFTNNKIDTFYNNYDGTGTITITVLNEIGDRTDKFEKGFFYGNNAGLNVVLSDDVKNQFHKEGETSTKVFDDTVEIGFETSWSKEFAHHEQVVRSYSDIEVVKDLNITSLKYDSHDVIISETSTKLTDTLKEVNQADIGENANTRFFTADNAAQEYTVTEDLGQTQGFLHVLGKTDGTNKSVINGNGHNLFELTKEGTAVDLVNVKVTGANAVANLEGLNTTFRLENTEIAADNGKIINETGTIVLNTGSVVNCDIEGLGKIYVQSGTNTINAKTVQGNMHVENGATIVNNNNFDLTAGLNNKGTIINNESLSLSNEADYMFTNIGNIINRKDLSIDTQFTNAGKIVTDEEGKGTLAIGSIFTQSSEDAIVQNQINVKENGSLYNNKAIVANDINNKGTITTNASKEHFSVSNMIQNDGTLNFTGGKNENAITSESNGTVNFLSSAENTADISNNTVVVQSGATLENTGNISGNVQNQANAVIYTNIENLIGNITNDGEIHYKNGGTTKANTSGSGVVHFDEGNVILNHEMGANKVSLNAGTLTFGTNKDLSAGGIIMNGGSVANTMDGAITEYKLGDAVINKTSNLDIDFDVSTLTSDKFTGTYSGDGKLNINNVRIQGSTLLDSIKVHLSDTTMIDREHLSARNQVLPQIMTPIRKLNGKIEDNYLMYNAAGNSAKDFNPAVMAAPVATLLGGYLVQSETMQQSFYHMDRYTKFARSERLASESANRYASNQINSYVNPGLPETQTGIWVNPYTSFEKVNLKGGLGVSNVSYGSLFGGDTELKDLGNGYKGVLSAFVGYNGNHIAYDGISMNQQGGTLGLTGTLYKGNFFTGLTISAGASAGEAYTMYGTDHFNMLTAGIANKTGYNWELANGKFIVQPSMFLGYTFVNTFDYTNSAGVKINSDPLNAIQIAPGVKFIGNLKNGWQPYIGVDMIWNIMGKTDFTANETRLPDLSVKPYVQYGVGVQKSWGERFNAFFQTVLRNGGRTGVVLQGGFRWTLGKDTTRTSSTAAVKTVIKK